MNVTYCGSKGSPHLLIVGAGIKVEGEGAWDARLRVAGMNGYIALGIHVAVAVG